MFVRSPLDVRHVMRRKTLLWPGLLVCACAALLSCTDPVEDTPDMTMVDTWTPDTFQPPSANSCGLLVCADGEFCCDYECIDPSSDNAHCGACSNACLGLSVCTQGQCVCNSEVTCGEDEVCCEEGCASIADDPNHCGVCGQVCAPGERCQGGLCTCLAYDGISELCSPSETCCPGLGCFALESDPLSCGTCGLACGPGELCQGGACDCGGSDCAQGQACCGEPASCQEEGDAVCSCGGLFCTSGQVCCDVEGAPNCVRVGSDPEHCGGCGLTCGPGSECRSGTCVCESGFADCDGDTANGCETALQQDVSHCGACGQACAAGEVCDGTGVCALTCQVGLTDCDGSCVNLASDERHCAACGATCEGGEVCDGAGSCSTSCQRGLTECGNSCFDLLSNRNHCGACGHACPPGFVCDGQGGCALSCQPGLRSCGGNCVNLQSYTLHCGACGSGCGSGEVCNGEASCEATCASGFTDCGTGCYDLGTTFGHCGACGQVCERGELCVAGQCQLSCPGFQVACGLAGCVDLSVDQEHCGRCDNVCTGGALCRDGVCQPPPCPNGLTACGASGCVDMQTEPTHCGACDQGCDAALESCVNGVCVTRGTCADGQITCNSRCVNANFDPNNCGACDVVCGSRERCSGGLCQCETGWLDCDGGVAGCEVFGLSSMDHCGACGNACDAATQACVSGSCRCLDFMDECDGDTSVLCETDLSNNTQNCGACGVSCATGEVCDSGNCVTRPPPVALSTIYEVRAGCRVTPSQHVECWGDGRTGMLGVAPPPVATYLPVEVEGLGPSDPVLDLAVGATHVCAVLTSGKVMCWSASNDHGELGCGACSPTGIPQEVSGLDGVAAKAVRVDVGYKFSCAALETGAVRCWGRGNKGQLGSGTGDQLTPVDVPGVSGAVDVYTRSNNGDEDEVTADNNVVYARLDDGGVMFWGNDTAPIAVQGIGAPVNEVAPTTGRTCALLNDESVSCWRNDTLSPQAFTAVEGVLSLRSSYNQVCGVLRDRSVHCWESRATCLGDSAGDPGGATALTLAGPVWANWALGAGTLCGVHQDDSVECQGSNGFGVARQRHVDLYASPVIVQGLQPTDVATLEARSDATCALNSSGDALCWGGTPQAFGLNGIAEFAEHFQNQCVRKLDGAVLCWGVARGTGSGQTGSNSITYTNALTVRGLDGVTSSAVDLDMARADGHACAALDSGEVWCWGNPPYLGTSNASDSLPNKADGFGASRAAVGVATGTAFGCAWTDTGAAYCWGDNTGTGQVGYRASPVQVLGYDGTSASIVDMAANENDVCAVTGTGTVVCWGQNYGAAPVQISGLTDAQSLTAGLEHSCVLLSTGAVQCWGTNDRGQLGDGTVISAPATPITVDLGGTAIAVSAGDFHTCALRDDASVACWGWNVNGQVGIPGIDTVCTLSPARSTP